MKRFFILPAILTLAVTGFGKLTDDLVVYLDFNDNTTNTADANAYPTNIIGDEGKPRYGEGRFGRAAVFRSKGGSQMTGDWAVALAPELEKVYAGDWTLSLWVLDTTTGDSVLIGNKDWGSGSNPGWAVAPMTTGVFGSDGVGADFAGKLNWSASGESRRHDRPFGKAESVSLDTPGWKHLVIVCSRTRGTMTVRINGKKVSVGIDALGAAATIPTGLSAGLRTVVGAAFNGRFGASATIDDVAIWSRALNDDELTLLESRPAKIPEPSVYGLVGAGALASAALIRRRRAKRRA